MEDEGSWAADPEVWGPAFWHFAHCRAGTHPLQATPKQKERILGFLKNVDLPCDRCMTHYEEWMRAHPVEQVVHSGLVLQKWLYDLHESVNAKIQKKNTPSFDVVVRRYGPHAPVPKPVVPVRATPALPAVPTPVASVARTAAVARAPIPKPPVPQTLVKPMPATVVVPPALAARGFGMTSTAAAVNSAKTRALQAIQLKQQQRRPVTSTSAPAPKTKKGCGCGKKR